MIRCLLFGHEPHPLFESLRIGVRRATCCERCGVGMWHVVDRMTWPIPEGSLTSEERDAVLAETIVATLLPALLPHTLKRKRSERRIPRKTAEPTETNGDSSL